MSSVATEPVKARERLIKKALGTGRLHVSTPHRDWTPDSDQSMQLTALSALANAIRS